MQSSTTPNISSAKIEVEPIPLTEALVRLRRLLSMKRQELQCLIDKSEDERKCLGEQRLVLEDQVNNLQEKLDFTLTQTKMGRETIFQVKEPTSNFPVFRELSNDEFDDFITKAKNEYECLTQQQANLLHTMEGTQKSIEALLEGIPQDITKITKNLEDLRTFHRTSDLRDEEELRIKCDDLFYTKFSLSKCGGEGNEKSRKLENEYSVFLRELRTIDNKDKRLERIREQMEIIENPFLANIRESERMAVGNC